MAQHITVTDYQPQWPEKYREEEALLREILGENCLAVYHIGSTSVPGLAAKPILDIMPVVKSLEAVDAAAKNLEAAGYEYLGEFGIRGRRYLRKGGEERTHQVHIFAWSDEENIRRHLAFRDYLRTHGKEREEYAALKRSLAQQFPYDIDGYCNGKDSFVKRLEQQALTQYDGVWDDLYLAARRVQKGRAVSPFVEAGGVAAAILTASGRVYTGVCIDTACSLGMCAERNAIASMITSGESRIARVVAIQEDGRIALPCGACREAIRQLNPGNEDTQILLDLNDRKTAPLRQLLPDWWGAGRELS